MVCLNLEDAPSHDTLWQIWVMLGLQFSREHLLSKRVEWDKVAQVRFGYGTVKRMCLLIFSFICHCFKEI